MCPHTHPLLANVSGMEVEHVRLAHIRKSNTPYLPGAARTPDRVRHSGLLAPASPLF